MPSYVTLINWTDQGVKNFKDTVDRYEAAQAAMGQGGVSFKDIYWTVGPYDVVLLCEAPDEESMTAALLRLGAAGNVRTTTLRALNRDEFNRVAERTG